MYLIIATIHNASGEEVGYVEASACAEMGLRKSFNVCIGRSDMRLKSISGVKMYVVDYLGYEYREMPDAAKDWERLWAEEYGFSALFDRL
jgi:hypothetical protein